MQVQIVDTRAPLEVGLGQSKRPQFVNDIRDGGGGVGVKEPVHCKKRLEVFPSPAGMSLTKLSLAGKYFNYSRPGEFGQ